MFAPNFLVSTWSFMLISSLAFGDAPKASIATKPMNAAEALQYEQEKLFGEPVRDAQGKILYIAENKTQTHSKDNFVLVRVKGFKTRKEETGRIRVAVWNSPTNYGKEGIAPFRASSYWAKEAHDNEMLFKIGGLEKGKQYSFFGHFDTNNNGKVNRVFGIPTEPYIFSNSKNQGKGIGLSRKGLSPPDFKDTLVSFTGPGQEIILSF
jgi:uncharacterized protein (DUF2141 family)